MSNETQTREDGTAPRGLFSGSFSIAEALRLMRLRLLDLTRRNRLLNFRHSPRRTIQVVGAAVDPVYQRLTGDGGKIRFIPVPDPSPAEHLQADGKPQKPEVRDYAAALGIATSYELPRPDRR